MANVLHRTTKQYLVSVNTPDYSPALWIIDPNISAVQGWPTYYWVITGDTVTLMDAAQRAAVDAARLAAARDSLVAQVDEVEDILRAFAQVLLDELNAHAAHINAILTAIDNGANLTAVKVNIAAIADYPSRTLAQLKASIRGKLGT